MFPSLSTEDFEYARALRLTIMLRGTAKPSPDGDRLSVFVSPVLVPAVPPAASADSPGITASANSEVINRWNVRHIQSGLRELRCLYRNARAYDLLECEGPHRTKYNVVWKLATRVKVQVDCGLENRDAV